MIFKTNKTTPENKASLSKNQVTIFMIIYHVMLGIVSKTKPSTINQKSITTSSANKVSEILSLKSL